MIRAEKREDADRGNQRQEKGTQPKHIQARSLRQTRPVPSKIKPIRMVQTPNIMEVVSSHQLGQTG